MTAFTIMKMSMQEEDHLPDLAVQAFRNAFKQASECSEVVYVKDRQLLKRFPNGEIKVLQDLSTSYQSLATSQRIFKRKKKSVTV